MVGEGSSGAATSAAAASSRVALERPFPSSSSVRSAPLVRRPLASALPPSSFIELCSRFRRRSALLTPSASPSDRAPRSATPLNDRRSSSRLWLSLSASPRYRPPRCPIAFQLKSRTCRLLSRLNAVASGRTPSSLTLLCARSRRCSTCDSPSSSDFVIAFTPLSPMRQLANDSLVNLVSAPARAVTPAGPRGLPRRLSDVTLPAEGVASATPSAATSRGSSAFLHAGALEVLVAGHEKSSSTQLSMANLPSTYTSVWLQIRPWTILASR